MHLSLYSRLDITSCHLCPFTQSHLFIRPYEQAALPPIDQTLAEQITPFSASQFLVTDQSSIRQLFCISETDFFLIFDWQVWLPWWWGRGGGFDWLNVSKNNLKGQDERKTPIHKRQTLKGPFVSKLKLQRNTEVTFCHFSPSTCCPAVVSCQGYFHSQKKAPSQIISSQACCLLWTISPWSILQRGHFILSIQTDHHCFVCSAGSQFPISYFDRFFFFSYLSVKGWVSTEAQFQLRAALHLHSDTHRHTQLSWEPPPCTSRVLSSSTGADGIKGKGRSVTVVSSFIFLHWAQARSDDASSSSKGSERKIQLLHSCFTISVSFINCFDSNWMWNLPVTLTQV